MANKVVVSRDNFNTLVNDNAALSGASFTGDVTVAGNLTVSGTTTTVTNLDISDNLIGLNNGLTGASSNDSGFIIERGSTGDNAFMGWDESEDKFTVGLTTTTATASSLGDLTITTGTLVANLEGNVIGDVSGNVTGTALTVTQPAQSAITSLGTLTGLTVFGTVNIDGSLNFTGGLAKTAVSSNISNLFNVTSDTAGISHALTLSGDLNGGTSLTNFTVTSNKVLATSVVVASSNLNVSITVHTVVAGSFQVVVSNNTGTTIDGGSIVILNYAIL